MLLPLHRQGEVSITLIATGFGSNSGPLAEPPPARSASPAANTYAPPPSSYASSSNGSNGSANGAAAAGAYAQPGATQEYAAPVVQRPVIVERPTPSNPRVRTDVPTGGVEIPAFLRRRGARK